MGYLPSVYFLGSLSTFLWEKGSQLELFIWVSICRKRLLYVFPYISLPQPIDL